MIYIAVFIVLLTVLLYLIAIRPLRDYGRALAFIQIKDGGGMRIVWTGPERKISTFDTHSFEVAASEFTSEEKDRPIFLEFFDESGVYKKIEKPVGKQLLAELKSLGFKRPAILWSTKPGRAATPSWD
jgi:hypothetical protein